MARDPTKKTLRKILVQIPLSFIITSKFSLKRNNFVANEFYKYDYFTFS